MKESYLYKKAGDYLECRTCNHHCRIAPYRRGICGVRENNSGKLNILNYGRVIAENIEPIEKKPLFHFLPKTSTLSIALIGCNFHCFWCQNDDISQMSKDKDNRRAIISELGVETEPQQIVDNAKKYQCPSISYTYTEPTVFLEFAIDTMKIANKEKIKNIWVSNGYFSQETLALIAPFMDAINIDLKSFKEETYRKYCGANLQPILNNIKDIYQRKIHLEITTLIIPSINDSDDELRNIAKFISQISPEIPWHISRFFPAYKMLDRETTPIETLERAEKIGKKAGLKYIYMGNV